MSAIYWFEIPVSDIQRAIQFYNQVLEAEIQYMDLTDSMGTRCGMIPDQGGVGGMLVEGEQHGYVPSQAGSLVYLNVSGKMEDVLARAEAAGAAVLLPKTSLGDHGFTAWIQDSEGNRVGLRSAE